jgi:hypothetical protein
MKDKIAFVDGQKITGTAPTQAAKTWTPTTSNQTIASGTILTGAQTIAGDADLKAANIKKGVNIFGVTGSYEGQAINGIVESYKVASGSATISAGDFVSYVNGLSGSSASTATVSSSQYAGQVISAVALSDSKVFIAHTGNTSKQLYGSVCTISGNTITVGTATGLVTSSYAGDSISAVALSDSKVFIAHSYTESATYLNGIVCTISGTTITKGTDTSLSSGQWSGSNMDAVALSDSKVFIAHRDSKDYQRLSGMICTISGTTITVSSDTLLNSEQYSGMYCKVVKLSDSKVFITHSRGDYAYLWGVACTISGTTVTAGTDKQIDTEYNSWSGKYKSVVALSDSKVFIVYQVTGGSNAIVCTISGTTTTLGTKVLLSNTTPYFVDTVALSSSLVFITHGSGSNTAMISTICHIAGTTIDIIEQGTALMNNASSASEEKGFSIALLGTNGVFVAYSSGSYRYLYARVLSGSIQVSKYNKGIAGLAKTGGSAGATISVVTPN